MENLSPEERQSSQVLTWRIRYAPSQCDIIWKNMQPKTYTDYFYSFMLNAFMLVTCILILSPIPIISFLNEFLNGIKGNKDDSDFLITTLQLYLQPLMIVTFNSGIIPLICDFIADLENHKTKSARQVAIMRKSFFFQSMNTIFLQITLQTTIKALLEQINDTEFDFDRMKALLLKNFSNFLFLNLSIQWCFISNGI